MGILGVFDHRFLGGMDLEFLGIWIATEIILFRLQESNG